MPLVAGVDSSTQSVKVVVRDATTGAFVRRGERRIRTAPRSAAGLVGRAAGRVRRRPPRRRRGAGRRGPAARHGRARRRRRGGASGPALERHPVGAGRRRPGRRARRPGGLGRRRRLGAGGAASRSPSCAGWPEPSRSNAARVDPVLLPHDWLTWRLAGTARREPDHRPWRRVRHRLLVAGDRRLPAATCSSWPSGRRVGAPAGAGPAEPVGETPSGALARAGHRRQHGCRARPRRCGRATSSCRSGTSGTAFAVVRARRAPTPPARRRVRRRDRPFPAAGAHAQRGAGARRAARDCSASTWPSFGELALSAQPGAGGLVLLPYLDGERTPNLPDATGSLHGLTRAQPDAGEPGPGRVEGHALRSRRRGRRPGGAGRRAPAGPAHRWRCGVARRSGRSRPGCSACPSTCRAAGEYVADGAARQAAWALAGAAEPPHVVRAAAPRSWRPTRRRRSATAYAGPAPRPTRPPERRTNPLAGSRSRQDGRPRYRRRTPPAGSGARPAGCSTCARRTCGRTTC